MMCFLTGTKEPFHPGAFCWGIWTLSITGEVDAPLTFRFDEIRRMPKAIVSNTLECSGNGRSLRYAAKT